MVRAVAIRRVVPIFRGGIGAEVRDFYAAVLGFRLAMEMGSMLTFASPDNETAQLSVIDADTSSAPVPDVTVEVTDVDHVYAEALRRGAQIVYPLSDESWGVRRFFVKDPNDLVLNVMQHHAPIRHDAD